MPRYLVCVDEVPAQDGTCAETVWMEQAKLTDFLPSHSEANAIGIAYFGTLMIVALAKKTLKPERYT